jgi:hypothetical protein
MPLLKDISDQLDWMVTNEATAMQQPNTGASTLIT